MENTLNHNSIVPLYAQIVEQLRHDIQAGLYRQTGRLPTEGELSDQYHVSRITIRRAVAWWKKSRARAPLSVPPNLPAALALAL